MAFYKRDLIAEIEERVGIFYVGVDAGLVPGGEEDPE